LAIGDMNGDGRPDVVAVDYDSEALVVLINNKLLTSAGQCQRAPATCFARGH
jgi:hypothetical protein